MNVQVSTNKFLKIFVIIISVFLTFCSSPVESEMLNSPEVDLAKQLDSIELEELSQGEIEGLLLMREEEKLARDVYITLFEKWNMNIFDNISNSEQRHTDAIKMLLDRYELEDPVENDELGVFLNSDLQSLYNTLITSAIDSSSALRVGAAIEEIDILDLQKQINEVVDNADILLVYNNLTRGSRNHLRAFVRNITNLGETYSPQYMEVAAYEEIINSDMERGGKGKRKGKGQGNGMGRKGRN